MSTQPMIKKAIAYVTKKDELMVFTHTDFLVERPIEIVKYQRHTCVCECCRNVQTASWSPDIFPGQDLGVRLQAFLGWVNNYAHMPYKKQQEMLWELGKIEIFWITIPQYAAMTYLSVTSISP